MINLLLCYSVLSIPYIFLVNIQWIKKNRYCCQTNALKKPRFLGSFGERERKKELLIEVIIIKLLGDKCS